MSDVELRKKAELFAASCMPTSMEHLEDLSNEETKQLFHELHVHQIELEMQNEELRRIQLELDTARTRYFELYDLAPAGYVTVSEKGLIIESNLTLANQVNISRKSLLGSRFSQLVFKDDQEGYYLHRKQLFETRQPHSCELRINRQGAAPFWAHLEAILVPDVNGANGYRVVLVDITERKKSELEKQDLFLQVQQEKERLALLIGSISDEVWFADTTGHFTLANPLACTTFNLENVDNLDIQQFAQSLEVFRPDGSSRPVEESPPLLALAGETILEQEEIVRLPKSGKLRYRTVSSAPVRNPQGAIIGCVSVVHDITEQKQVEEKIRALNASLELRVQQRTAELQEKNRELEAFSYSVSHDLRTPLRGIEGFTQIFIDEYGNLIPEKGLEYLERVRRSSLHMGQLIDSMLVLSKLSRSAMHIEELDLSALTVEVAGELDAENPNRDIHVDIEPGMTTEGDSSLLRIVLVNLLSNAWKFASIREHAHIRVGTTMDPVHGLSFFIRDDGVGFDNAYKDKLFSAFQRLHSEKEYPGTGIGLATVARIIHRHGGEVWAEGEVDKGAAFYFSIPSLRSTAQEKHNMQ